MLTSGEGLNYLLLFRMKIIQNKITLPTSFSHSTKGYLRSNCINSGGRLFSRWTMFSKQRQRSSLFRRGSGTSWNAPVGEAMTLSKQAAACKLRVTYTQKLHIMFSVYIYEHGFAVFPKQKCFHAAWPRFFFRKMIDRWRWKCKVGVRGCIFGTFILDKTQNTKNVFRLFWIF